MLGRTRRIHFVGDRRHRDERDRGAAREPRLRGERLGCEGVGRDGSAGERSACGSRAGTTPRHVGNADVVVISSAIQAGQPGGRRKRGGGAIPVIPRAEMLAELMRLRYGIAIAGAHGKTTTTSMVALVLERAGLDPTAVIGGRLSAFGSNARLGRGDYMVVEADESDRSFLKLSPSIAVITNIDREHMESYGSWDALQQAFVDFANKVPFYGAVVACVDDAPVRALRAAHDAPRHHLRPRRTAAPRSTGHGMALEAFGSRCRVMQTRREGGSTELGSLRLRVPGRHNLLNALGAVAVGLEVGVPFAQIARGARGVPRRRAALPAARRSARRDGGRRLRPSPDRDRGGDCRRARRARPPRRRRVPAAPLHAHARSARRVRRRRSAARTRSS